MAEASGSATTPPVAGGNVLLHSLQSRGGGGGGGGAPEDAAATEVLQQQQPSAAAELAALAEQHHAELSRERASWEDTFQGQLRQIADLTAERDAAALEARDEGSAAADALASARQREAHLSAELASQEAEVAEERARAASLEEVVKGCNTAMQTAAHSRDEMEGLLELEQRGHAETELRLQALLQEREAEVEAKLLRERDTEQTLLTLQAQLSALSAQQQQQQQQQLLLPPPSAVAAVLPHDSPVLFASTVADSYHTVSGSPPIDAVAAAAAAAALAAEPQSTTDAMIAAVTRHRAEVERFGRHAAGCLGRAITTPAQQQQQQQQHVLPAPPASVASASVDAARAEALSQEVEEKTALVVMLQAELSRTSEALTELGDVNRALSARLAESDAAAEAAAAAAAAAGSREVAEAQLAAQLAARDAEAACREELIGSLQSDLRGLTRACGEMTQHSLLATDELDSERAARLAAAEAAEGGAAASSRELAALRAELAAAAAAAENAVSCSIVDRLRQEVAMRDEALASLEADAAAATEELRAALREALLAAAAAAGGGGGGGDEGEVNVLRARVAALEEEAERGHRRLAQAPPSMLEAGGGNMAVAAAEERAVQERRRRAAAEEALALAQGAGAGRAAQHAADEEQLRVRVRRLELACEEERGHAQNLARQKVVGDRRAAALEGELAHSRAREASWAAAADGQAEVEAAGLRMAQEAAGLRAAGAEAQAKLAAAVRAKDAALHEADAMRQAFRDLEASRPVPPPPALLEASRGLQEAAQGSPFVLRQLEQFSRDLSSANKLTQEELQAKTAYLVDLISMTVQPPPVL